jgi:hypothetical protein
VASQMQVPYMQKEPDGQQMFPQGGLPSGQTQVVPVALQTKGELQQNWNSPLPQHCAVEQHVLPHTEVPEGQAQAPVEVHPVAPYAQQMPSPPAGPQHTLQHGSLSEQALKGGMHVCADAFPLRTNGATRPPREVATRTFSTFRREMGLARRLVKASKRSSSTDFSSSPAGDIFPWLGIA